MKASIVIPSYNFLDLLKITLNSLQFQDIPASDYEIIVIDDGSTDGTGDFLKNYRELNLKVITNPKNSGRAVSRNKGFHAASADLIIFMDADIEVQKDFIGLHIKAHENEYCAIIGKVSYPPDFKKNSLMKYLDSRGENRIAPGGKVPGKYFRTANVSVPKKLMEEVGGFDESYTFYGGEDIVLGFKLEKKVNIYYLAEAVGYHRHFRILDDSMKLVKNIGEHTLPGIFKNYPGLRENMKLGKNINNFFYKFFCSSLFYYPLKFLAKIELAPYFVFSYLYYRNYRQGYLNYLKRERLN